MASLFEDAQIITTMLKAIDIASGAFDNAAVQAVEVVLPIIYTLFTLYVMIWGWAMMRGMVQEPVMDAVMRIGKMALIMVIALNSAYYAAPIKDIVWTGSDEVARTITTNLICNDTTGICTPGMDSSATIIYAEIFGAALKIGSAYMTDADDLGTNGVPDLSLLAIGIGVWGGGAALTGIIVGTLVIAKIILATLLAVGPIFILLILFESTKKLFDAWLGQVVSYMLVIITSIIASVIVMQIMTVALGFYLGLDFMQWIISESMSSPPPGTGIGIIIMYGICGVAIQKIVMAADAIGRSVSLTSYVGYK